MDYRDDHADFLDTINMMDMMPMDRRDVHADVLEMMNMIFEMS